jgi:hypothetical protein
MARMFDRNGVVGKEELNLFKLPATQVATERSRYLSIYPKNGVSETMINSPITFEISGVPDYLDLHKNYLKIRFQIRKSDGTAMDNNVEVAPINYISNSFVQQMKIFLNNKLVSESSDTYIYRSYIETLINYSKEAKYTYLQLGGWHQDEIVAGQNSVDHVTNPGFVKRKALSSQSMTFEVLAPLHADIFNQTNYMLPNINLRLELYRCPNAKVLMKLDNADETNYQLHIKHIEWNVRVVEVSKTMAIVNEKRLLKEVAKYQLIRSIVKSQPLPTGTQDVRNLEIFNGQQPTSLVIGFIESAAFHGNDNSPFNFKPFDLEHIQAIVGGRRWPSERPLEMDFRNNILMETYFQFLNNSGFGSTFQESNGVTIEMYKKHCFFVIFDFRSDENDDDSAVDLIKQGETRIFLRFRTALPVPVHMISYLSFDNVLRIDKGRNAIVDYSI